MYQLEEIFLQIFLEEETLKMEGHHIKRDAILKNVDQIHEYQKKCSYYSNSNNKSKVTKLKRII